MGINNCTGVSTNFFSSKSFLLIFFPFHVILSIECSPWILGIVWLLLQFHNLFLITMKYFNNNYLIAESEVVTGKSQTEALSYWPNDSEVNTVGRGLRFSRNDRTVEVIKLFIIWLMN